MANDAARAQSAAAFRAEGAANLRRTLRAAGDDLTDLRNAHARAGMIASAEGVRRAPRAPGSNMLASTVRFGATKTAATIRAGNNSTVPYAGVIHYGWPARNITAQPWLTEAAQATEPEWIPIYERAVESALAQVRGA